MNTCFRIQSLLVIAACTCLFALAFSVLASAASPEIRVFAKPTDGSQLSEVANWDVLPSGTLVRFQITVPPRPSPRLWSAGSRPSGLRWRSGWWLSSGLEMRVKRDRIGRSSQVHLETPVPGERTLCQSSEE